MTVGLLACERGGLWSLEGELPPNAQTGLDYWFSRYVLIAVSMVLVLLPGVIVVSRLSEGVLVWVEVLVEMS